MRAFQIIKWILLVIFSVVLAVSMGIWAFIELFSLCIVILGGVILSIPIYLFWQKGLIRACEISFFISGMLTGIYNMMTVKSRYPVASVQVMLTMGVIGMFYGLCFSILMHVIYKRYWSKKKTNRRC